MLTKDQCEAMAARIDVWMRAQDRWIPAKEIAAAFEVPQRRLRSSGPRAGLCSAFAISGDAGLKHVACATEEEFQAFDARLRSHSVAQFQRLRKLRNARREILRAGPPFVTEADTGQGILL